MHQGPALVSLSGVSLSASEAALILDGSGCGFGSFLRPAHCEVLVSFLTPSVKLWLQIILVGV